MVRLRAGDPRSQSAHRLQRPVLAGPQRVLRDRRLHCGDPDEPELRLLLDLAVRRVPLCFVVGFLFGLPALRLQGIYLALATFALATAMPQIFEVSTARTVDRRGARDRPVETRPARGPAAQRRPVALLFHLGGIAASCSRGRRAWSRAAPGAPIMAIRDHPIAAAAMGINTSLYKTADLWRKRALHGHSRGTGRHRHPVRRAGQLSVPAVGVVSGRAVVGGVGSIPGSLVGGVFVLFVPNLAERVSTGLSGAVYGVILLIVIFVMPSGAAGFVRRAAARLIPARNSGPQVPKGGSR